MRIVCLAMLLLYYSASITQNDTVPKEFKDNADVVFITLDSEDLEEYDNLCSQAHYQKPSKATIWFRQVGAKFFTFYTYCKKMVQIKYSSFKQWLTQKNSTKKYETKQA